MLGSCIGEKIRRGPDNRYPVREDESTRQRIRDWRGVNQKRNEATHYSAIFFLGGLWLTLFNISYPSMMWAFPRSGFLIRWYSLNLLELIPTWKGTFTQNGWYSSCLGIDPTRDPKVVEYETIWELNARTSAEGFEVLNYGGKRKMVQAPPHTCWPETLLHTWLSATDQKSEYVREKMI